MPLPIPTLANSMKNSLSLSPKKFPVMSCPIGYGTKAMPSIPFMEIELNGNELRSWATPPPFQTTPPPFQKTPPPFPTPPPSVLQLQRRRHQFQRRRLHFPRRRLQFSSSNDATTSPNDAATSPNDDAASGSNDATSGSHDSYLKHSCVSTQKMFTVLYHHLSFVGIFSPFYFSFPNATLQNCTIATSTATLKTTPNPILSPK